MSQYLQFRLWARNSSGAEKRLAATAVVVVVGLASWSLLPTSSPGDSAVLETQGASSAPGSTGASNGGSTTGSAGGPTSVGGSSGIVGGGSSGLGGSSGSGPTGTVNSSAGGSRAPGGGGFSGTTGTNGGGTQRPAGTTGCSAGGATDVGVTATTVTAASVLLNLGGPIGNSAVGVASPDQARQMTDAVVAEVNAHGGAACRKIVVKYYEVNPLDSSSSQNACLQIVQDKNYAVVDGTGFAYPPGAADCIPQHKVPLFGGPPPVPSESKQYYPYYMSLSYDTTVSSRNAVRGMQMRGFFDASKGFKKLGLYMDDCSPEVNNSLLKDLAGIGIKQGDISIYKFTCPPGGFASPNDASAAVLQHQRDGVTNVIPVTGGGSFKPYSVAAERQNYRPKYTILDYNGFPITTTGGTGPDHDNFDGTTAVTSIRIGQESSGISDPATDACRALFKRHGLNPNWVDSNFNGGSVCNAWQVFAAAASKAPSLTRTNLAQGLSQLGRVGMAYIQIDAIFGPGDLVGGDFWRVIQYHKDCNCWKVVDRTLHPSFR